MFCPELGSASGLPEELPVGMLAGLRESGPELGLDVGAADDVWALCSPSITALELRPDGGMLCNPLFIGAAIG